MTTIIDPPEGYRYGFPKPIPEDICYGDVEDYLQWFRDQGYPDRLIAQGMLKYCRYWKASEE